MVSWDSDDKGRLSHLETETGPLYRLADVGLGRWQLSVFPDPARRSCDRRAYPSYDEADRAARGRILHDREVRALGRETAASRVTTPWGTSRTVTSYCQGIDLLATAGADVFRLSAERNARVPSAVRSTDGWYVEDEAGAVIVLTFPDRFTAAERSEADEAALEWDDDLRLEFGLAPLAEPEMTPGSP